MAGADERPGEDVVVRLDCDQLDALDGWIARHPDPRPTRGKAIVELLAGTLGSHGPSTVVPSLVTGRDIV